MNRTLYSLCCLAVLSGATHASLVIFSGSDAGANSTDPRPNSIAAAAAFDAAAGALGTVNLIDFESAPVGAFSSLAAAPGVTLTGADFGGGNQRIESGPIGSPDSLYGYNTTSGGANFASFFGGTMTFTFATPIQAFGAYFSGVQLGGETITFNDGTSQTIGLVNQGSGVQFLGFTDAGKSIASIRIDVLNDIVGMDDVRFVSSPVPEPFTMALAAGALATGLARRRRR